jgi:soluble lytic murein transglycosylase-like protein
MKSLIAIILLLVPVCANASAARRSGAKRTARTGASASSRADIDRYIKEAGAKYDVDPALIRLVVGQESAYRTNARSRKNAMGLMQTIPATAQRFGVSNPYDARQNVEGGTRYLRWLLQKFCGDVQLTLAGYNAGENRVTRFGGKVPPYRETRNYVSKIIAKYGKSYHPVPKNKAAKPATALVTAD